MNANDYDWEYILQIIKSYARIEEITDIILLGKGEGTGLGIRRIKLTEEKR